MTMLAEQVDGVIGVDTHRDTLAAAIVTPIGAVLAHTDATADAHGYKELLHFARRHIPGARCWALEGAGSYGAGLATFLDAEGERVVEVCRPKRPAQRGGRKTDQLDAVRAAREALASEQLIHPRRRGEREALRVLLTTRHSAVLAATAAINHLKALIVSAPEDLRAELRGKSSSAQITYCAELNNRPDNSLEHRMTIRAMRSAARRILTLRAEAKDLETELATLVQQIAPDLINLAGVGPISAAQILISWSHPGRFRSEAAFAAFAGAVPIPASSGMTHRHRLNRGGDRQLNRALHTITLIRMRVDPATRAYIAKRAAEGKTSRDAQRCIKRALAARSSNSSNEPHPKTASANLRPAWRRLDTT
ncbi:IS110 family transposase [Amycolatopsis sp. NPDC051061]|uniref:IS110 family transposase n=1 Tax=Amycolatopsis sp. NPDC051061 TaxID=3155042 RepID=UPI0034446484